MDINPPFIANREALERLESGESPFHHPAVLAEFPHRLDSPSGDPGDLLLVPAEAERCVPRVQRAGFLGPSKYTMHPLLVVQGFCYHI